MLQEGAIAGGRFRLVRPIGHGGMASVWWAIDELRGGEVAIKIAPASSDPERSARFLREARTIAKFNHPNIVRVIEAGELQDEGLLYMAMELLRGCPLAERLEASEPLAPEEVLAVMIEVCRGLECAHAAGVVHRDIKPENIFLANVPGRGVVPKILDFGVSTGGDRRSMPRLSGHGQILGTPAYMSPEQAIGRLDITPAADLWAVGVILYEALSGKLPFFGRNAAALLDAIVGTDPAEPPEGVDEKTRAIIARLLDKNPARRYRDAALLRIDLERVLDAMCPTKLVPTPDPSLGMRPGLDPEQVGSRPPISRPPRAQRQALARPKSAFLIAPFAVAICVGALLAAPRRRPDPIRLESGVARAAKARAAALGRAAREAPAPSSSAPAP